LPALTDRLSIGATGINMHILTLRSRVLAWVVPLAIIAALALVTAPAHGAAPPAFTAGPVIEGPAAVGSELQITGAWTGVPAPSQVYEWDRCDASGLFCDVVGQECAATHVVNDGDVGSRLRAQVQLFNAVGTITALTPLSDLVAGVGPGPDRQGKHNNGNRRQDRGGSSSGGGSGRGDRRSRPRSCAPVVPPAVPVQPAEQPAAEPPAAVPTAASSPSSPFLQPFPTVRIAGYTVAGGARITLMSVRGGAPAVVRVTCTGAGCGRRELSPAHPPTRLRALERIFRAPTVLQIRVTAAATIGKYTSFRILAHRQPRRVDRCLMPGRWAPVRCPAP
jgi:hypothetical protein